MARPDLAGQLTASGGSEAGKGDQLCGIHAADSCVAADVGTRTRSSAGLSVTEG